MAKKRERGKAKRARERQTLIHTDSGPILLLSSPLPSRSSAALRNDQINIRPKRALAHTHCSAYAIGDLLHLRRPDIRQAHNVESPAHRSQCVNSAHSRSGWAEQTGESARQQQQLGAIYKLKGEKLVGFFVGRQSERVALFLLFFSFLHFTPPFYTFLLFSQVKI